LRIQDVIVQSFHPTRLFLMLALIAPFQGCASMNQRPTELLPTRSTYRTGPFAIHSHKAMRHKDPIVQELESLTREVAARIGGPVPGQDKTVDVYILADEPSFQHFLHYYHPELPSRRAYFIATEKTRSVYTYQGDHLMEDIRHESTHALVNLTHPGLPLWLDEGLAEVFEHPDRDKTPDPHRERFLSDINTGFKPDLNRLESMDDVRKFTPRDYREAWAWVEWGLIGPKDSTKAFRSYLDDVMRLGESESVVALKPLSVRWSEANPDMKVPQTAMLAWIGEQKQAADVAAKAPVDKDIKQTRLQNSEIEKQSVETKRSTLTTVRHNQSMLGRFYSSLFGQSK
jgi:D-ribose pyranose/furanose isomerase RbsD